MADQKPWRLPRDHMGRQFTYVFHSSQTDIPTHLLPGENFHYRDWGNIHPSSFHAGTSQAARERYGTKATHIYRVHRSVMDPMVWGDNLSEMPEFIERMRGVQPMLGESVSLDANMLAKNAESKTPLVLPYRNQGEDKASLSFVIPKRLVGSGVDFLGTVVHSNVGRD